MGNSKRSVHVVVTVAFAIMIISTSFAVANGFVSVVNRLTWGYTITDLFIMFEEGESLSRSMVDPVFLESLPEDVDFCPVYLGVVNQSVMGRLDLYGVNEVSFRGVRRPSVQGEFPDESGEVLAGVVLAKKYGIMPGSVFDVEIRGQTRSVMVTGTIRCSSSYDLGLVTSEKNFASFFGSGGRHYQYIELKVPDVAGFDQNIGEDYKLEVKPMLAMQDYIRIVTGEIRTDLVLLSFIIAIIVSLLVGHTMYKIVYDSVNELRVMRCIGVTRNGLFQLVLLDSILLSLTGAVIGLLLGIVFANLLSIGVFIVLRSVYYPASFEADVALYCLALSVVLGLLGGEVAIVFVKPEKRIVQGGVA